MGPVTKICLHCGSTDIGMETTVSWDVKTQLWEPAPIYEGDCKGYCNACGRDEFEPMTCDKDEPAEHFRAYNAGWRQGGDNGGFWYDGKVFESWKAAASWSGEDSTTYGTAREVCEGEDLNDV
jgi:hypothetical protein